MIGGFQRFVAWRYLLNREAHVSRPLVTLLLACVLTSVIGLGLGFGLEWWFVREEKLPPYNPLVAALSNLHEYDSLGLWIMRGTGVVLLGVGILLALMGGRWRSTIAWALIVAGVLSGVFGAVGGALVEERTFAEWSTWWGGVALAPLALVLPLLLFRLRFTFFTTVSMSGVFVGAMALVIVLSVMGGFENDLREKILASNAHIRVTKDEGMMTDWQAVVAELEEIPGVVAVTPFATTEVVLSANSNYSTVIIKGIDPATVGQVTELIADIEGDEADDAAAMERLLPLREDDLVQKVEVPDDGEDAGVPDQVDEGDAGEGEGDDFPDIDEPMDYSGGEEAEEEEPEEVDAGAAKGKGTGKGRASDAALVDPDADEPLDLSGGVEPEPLDPVDARDQWPRRLGGDAGVAAAGDAGADDDDDDLDDLDGDAGPVHTLTLDDDDLEPGLRDLPDPEGNRLQLLDGVLVGRELVKQLHLYAGQEVRLVSPLADPANPDANGTPIPYHRDYRIAGVFYTGMYEYDLKFVYVTLESLQEFLQLGDEIDGLEIRVRDPDDTASVRAAIARKLGAHYVVQDWKELNRNLFSALKLEKIAMFLVLAIIILVAGFSIVGNLIMVVIEKGKEIALLKTLGASDIGVLTLFVAQGFFIGLVGTLSGIVEGLVICVACEVFGFPINPDVYYISQLPIHIDLSSVIAIAIAGLVISAVATVYPAAIAARLRPAVGLRHD